MRVLVVEDESDIAQMIALSLRHEGFDCQMAGSAEQALQLIADRLPDMVVLDWMLPGQSGIQLIRHLRGDQRTRFLPILLLTARSNENDKIEGLERGADDFLTKPFSPRELIARIRAILRRRSPEMAANQIRLGALLLCSDTHQLQYFKDQSSVSIKLGPTEFKLMRFLMTYPRKAHSRRRLLDKIWGDHVFLEERTVDVHIKRLRESLAPYGLDNCVQTIRGAGYLLDDQLIPVNE